LSGEKKLRLNTLNPPKALSLGLDYLSENRKEEGLAVGMSIGANTTLSSLKRFASLSGWGLLSLGDEEEKSRKWIGDLKIRCQGPGQGAGNLSGGNQQKVALARLMERGGDILLLDEPTKGVDVGSKAEIYRLIHRLASEGKGILFVSSYLPELLGVCDTLAVMHRGRLSPVRKVGEWDEHSIMRTATSGT
jgi:ribose transport system ATP-binding protein